MSQRQEAVPTATEPRDDGLQIITFNLDGETYGMDIRRVIEITRMLEITHMPRALAFIEGIINLRGRIIPVMELRRRLGLAARPHDKTTRIVIVRMAGRRLGMLVDAVSRVATLRPDQIEAVPESTLQRGADFVSGVGHLDRSLVILLDLEKILTTEEKEQLAATKPKKEQAP